MQTHSLCSRLPPSVNHRSPSHLSPSHLSPAHHSLTHRLWHLLREGTGWVGRLIERWFDWYGCRYKALRHRRDLASMDDAMLKDIGLSRADIEPEISKGFWRR
jgi:uncharacterized protein YjiS (DUF1127 family)